MGETFYDALGVGEGASEHEVSTAFRNAVKSKHPDVLDAGDADEEFKRLKAARDVLVDGTERDRYDSLGHESYLRTAGPVTGWEQPEPTATPGPTEAGPTGGTVRKGQHYADGGQAAEDISREEPTRPANPDTATSYYQPGHRVNPERSGGFRVRLADLRSLGPWLVLDCLLVICALLTAAVILSWGALSALSILLAVALMTGALGITTLHVSVFSYH
jgi:curved DNA-binding protein CbpA